VRTALTTWLLLCGLLLQSVTWLLPAERAGQAERLAHAVAHAIDHGHHAHPDDHEDGHDALGHEVEAALQWEPSPDHGHHLPHHSHAGEGQQVQGLPVLASPQAQPLPHGPPVTAGLLHRPSAPLDGLLRPPRARA
jgi:hypothetical protein